MFFRLAGYLIDEIESPALTAGTGLVFFLGGIFR